MLFSLEWLRMLCPIDAEPAAIAAALTARGLTVDGIEAVGDDHVLDVDVPANRPDCLGHLGLAREIAAVSGAVLRAERPAPAGQGADAASRVRVFVDEPELCRRYTARILGDVRVGPSPAWVVRRLEACGLRSINNVVDASNLVMLETGNPIHFFDLERIGGCTIRVRRAGEGETLTTLDGVARRLDRETLVIADAGRAIALAGVMGGADTEIGAGTREVLVEAAWFLPRSVRASSRRLGLKTDAAHRFERGVDELGLERAQSLAAALVAELAGGKPAPGLVDVHPRPLERRALSLRLPRLASLLGYAPDRADVERALGAVGLAPQRTDAERLAVEVPSWRVDLEREVDLVEEVARHLGYDRAPTTMAGLPSVRVDDGPPSPAHALRDRLAARGFHEAFGYAMIAAGQDAAFVEPGAPEPLRLVNPIAESLACLRRSILPGLLRAVHLNLRRGARDVRLFEIGHVFRPAGAGEFPIETERAGLAWTGAGRPCHWSEPDREVDLHDVSGIVEQLLGSARPAARFRRRPHELSAFQPGLAVRWETSEGHVVAWAGALDPRVEREIEARVYLAEIDVEALSRLPSATARYESLPRHTEVTRDLSLILGPRAIYEDIVAVLSAVPAPARVSFEAVDRYSGPPLDPGQCSLTIRVRLHPAERTLTEEQIETYRRGLIDRLASDLGLAIRE